MELVVVFEGNFMQAQMISDLLNQENIQSFTHNENMATLYGGAVGGCRITVAEKDAERARTIIQTYSKNFMTE